ncbi:hypothetical protein ACSVDA_00220 [Cytobacillus sp. Hm23]
MSNTDLFTAIYIPETPFVNGLLKPKRAKKFKFKISKTEKIAETLYHYLYKKEDMQIHCYYFIGDLDDKLERYLFVENNALYDEFISQFWGGGQRYWEWGMDTYLEVTKPKEILHQLEKVYNNNFYEEDESMPTCHIYGQQSWHGNAFLIANRAALTELREAIDTALNYEEARLTLSPSDDEGYYFFIKCTEEDFKWEMLEMPYHDRVCYQPDETVKIPPYKAFKNYKRFFSRGM